MIRAMVDIEALGSPPFALILECAVVRNDAAEPVQVIFDMQDQPRRRIAKSLDSKTLLIVDELHQLAISAGRNAAMKVMEYIRELMDVSGCGLVVCGTRALDQDLINGELKGWLEQFRERCIKRLELPDRMPDSDILLVAKTYGLPEPDETTMSLVRTWRMNRLCKTIMLAGNLAAKRDQPLSWRHVAAAHNAVSQ